jgi:hypothetical protein
MIVNYLNFWKAVSVDNSRLRISTRQSPTMAGVGLDHTTLGDLSCSFGKVESVPFFVILCITPRASPATIGNGKEQLIQLIRNKECQRRYCEAVSDWSDSFEKSK